MSINGKLDGITIDDLRAVAGVASLKRGLAESVLAEVIDAVRGWPELAAEVGVDEARAAEIAATHRRIV